ncbi:MAG: hypothetical protein U1F20_04160 [Lysobacterales bacterium]
MRTLLADWQRLSPATRMQGPEALAGVLTPAMEGFEAAAGAWESEVLPARVKDYSITWLDDLCAAGRIAWTRLRAGGDSLVRAAPIVLLPRRELPLWSRLAAAQSAEDTPCLRARRRSPIACANAARCSSTNCSMPRICWKPNWRTRWPNWSRAGRRVATASPDCARCCCRRRRNPPATCGAEAGGHR